VARDFKTSLKKKEGCCTKKSCWASERLAAKENKQKNFFTEQLGHSAACGTKIIRKRQNKEHLIQGMNLQHTDFIPQQKKHLKTDATTGAKYK
jgi:hypothetical protein